MNINKALLAKSLGWGQFAIALLNEALKANGGVLPTTKSGWLTLLSSLVMALAVHHASSTSADNPTGHK